MARALVVARRRDEERLLEALRELGVLHLVPVQPVAEGDERELAQALARLRQALLVLRARTPQGHAAGGSALEVADETLEAQRQEHDLHARLVALEREARAAGPWGRVSRERLAELRERGVHVRLVALSEADLPNLPGAAVRVGELGSRRCVALNLTQGDAELPARAQVVPPPERDLDAIEKDITHVRGALADGARWLGELAGRADDLERAARETEERIAFLRALHGGLSGERLFGVQGWLPAARAEALGSQLGGAGLEAAVHVRPADPGETPPTLVRYPRALRPIRALFDLLGVRPGYEEPDLSVFFMVAVSLFAGMLISDAGYGIVFLLASWYAQRRWHDTLDDDAVHLLMTFGAAALGWGAVTGAWFGVAPSQMRSVGGPVGVLGGILDRVVLLRGTFQETTNTLIKFCFLLGSTHLILAHLRRVIVQLPAGSAFADLGWTGVLAAMLAVIWNLFFREAPLPNAIAHALFTAGAAGFLLVAAFGAPARNPLVRRGKGIASALFPLIGAFGDTLSYIRLGAIGIAGSYLALATNTLAAQAADAGTWLAGLPVLVVGHGLNMALALVAILAHGVRLNLLEFSGHAGLQWSGYPYRPFARVPKER